MNEIIIRADVSERIGEICIKAFEPEIKGRVYERSKVYIHPSEGEGKGLVLHITATDLHALRVAANTYIRWLDMCIELALL